MNNESEDDIRHWQDITQICFYFQSGTFMLLFVVHIYCFDTILSY